MREIVPYIAELGDLNLKDTLMAGVMIDNLTTFFKIALSAHLSDLIENGKSQGAVIFVPGISAKELQSQFTRPPKDDFYDENDEDDGWDVETITDETFEPHAKAREIKRKARR